MNLGHSVSRSSLNPAKSGRSCGCSKTVSDPSQTLLKKLQPSFASMGLTPQMQTKLSNSSAAQTSSTTSQRSVLSPRQPFPRQSSPSAQKVCQPRPTLAPAASAARPARPCGASAPPPTALPTRLPSIIHPESGALEPLAFLLLTAASVFCLAQNAVTTSRLPETVAVLSRWLHGFLS